MTIDKSTIGDNLNIIGVNSTTRPSTGNLECDRWDLVSILALPALTRRS